MEQQPVVQQPSPREDGYEPCAVAMCENPGRVHLIGYANRPLAMICQADAGRLGEDATLERGTFFDSVKMKNRGLDGWLLMQRPGEVMEIWPPESKMMELLSQYAEWSVENRD